MALKDLAIRDAWVGHLNFLDEIMSYAGDPDSNTITASFKGQICYDSSSDDWYINTTDSTTWKKINY